MTSTATLIHLSSHQVSSPGPAAYQIPSEFGKKSAYIFKQYEKKEDRPDPAIVAVPSSFGSGPKYHFSSRHYLKDTENTPGPNYSPPAFGSHNPPLYLHSKGISYKETISCGPGPGLYDSRQKSYSPRYTISNRTTANQDEPMPDGPGPGLYFPNYSYLQPHSPVPHMTNVQNLKTDSTPGPNYLPNDRPHIPSLTFHHPQPKSRKQPPPPSPGPSDYPHFTKTGSESPRYTIKHRPQSKNSKPDPSLVAIPSTIGTGPKYSLTSRRPLKEKEITPGPSYVPPPFGSSSPRLSFHGKPSAPLTSMPGGPGPGKYDTRKTDKSHCIAIKGKDTTREVMADGPGPGKYLPQYDRVLPSSPKTQIMNKYAEKKPQKSGEYSYMPQTKVKGIAIGSRDNSEVLPGTFV